MIVIEGWDGAGKSTLCENLSTHRIVNEVLPSPRVAAKSNEERMIYETKRYLKLHGKNNHVAVDRFLFSEMVYGPILRDKCSFTKPEYYGMMMELLNNGSIVIFCCPDYQSFKANENPLVIERIDQIKKAYRSCAEDMAFVSDKVYIYKWHEENALAKLIQFIEEKR